MLILKKRRLSQRIRNALTVLFAVIYLIPLYIAITNSVKSYADVLKSPLALTVHPTMQNFVDAFHQAKCEKT